MSNDPENLVSAQVVLSPAGVSAASDVIANFAQAGFRTGPLVVNNFSIEAPKKHFEQYFHVTLEHGPRGGVRTAQAGGAPLGQELQLSLKALPPHVRSKVETILFTEPPAFGPTGTFA